MKGWVRIYMPLLDEGVDVWRPIKARHLRGDVYLVPEKPPGTDGERWAFDPGVEVVCEMVESSGGPILAATEKARP